MVELLDFAIAGTERNLNDFIILCNVFLIHALKEIPT